MKTGINGTTIEEVLEATRIHLRALRAMRRKGQIDGSLGDVIEGMAKSADKLRLALEDAGRQGVQGDSVVVEVSASVEGWLGREAEERA
jgi:hypothetical protein